MMGERDEQHDGRCGESHRVGRATSGGLDIVDGRPGQGEGHPGPAGLTYLVEQFLSLRDRHLVAGHVERRHGVPCAPVGGDLVGPVVRRADLGDVLRGGEHRDDPLHPVAHGGVVQGGIGLHGQCDAVAGETGEVLVD
jgi:hypothetical protein